MNFFKSIFKPKFKIETIKTQDNCAISYSPTRGGLITSIIIKGKEILYLDESTFLNIHQSVRGGIPILFPNAGALVDDKNNKFKDLKQHGFARNSNKWISEKGVDNFIETLISNDETKEVYPYDFKLRVSAQIEKDNSITIEQGVENTNSASGMPIAMGLHPYFKVKDIDKKNILFNWKGGEIVKENFPIWSEGGTVYIDNPKVNDPEAKLEIFIPGLGNLSLDVSASYQKIWIWSLPGKDFICIEPMMRGLNGLNDDPEIIKPNSKFSASINLNLNF